MASQNFFFENSMSSANYLFAIGAFLGWMLLVDSGSASQNPPDVCRDVTKMEQYAAEHIPESLWNDKNFIKASNYEQNKQYEQAVRSGR